MYSFDGPQARGDGGATERARERKKQEARTIQKINKNPKVAVSGCPAEVMARPSALSLACLSMATRVGHNVNGSLCSVWRVVMNMPLDLCCACNCPFCAKRPDKWDLMGRVSQCSLIEPKEEVKR